MSLLDDMVRLQPGFTQIARQIGLYKQKEKEERIAQRTQDIIGEATSEMQNISGGKDTLASMMADPYKYYTVANKKISELMSINPDAAKQFGDWFGSMMTSGRQIKKEDETTAFQNQKISDVFNIPENQPFEVEVPSGNTVKKLDIAGMTVKEAQAAGVVLTPFMRENLLDKQMNKQAAADKARLIDQIKLSIHGNLRTSWNEQPYTATLSPDLYKEFENQMMSEVESKGTSMRQGDVAERFVNKYLKEGKIKQVDALKAYKALEDVAGRTLSASRDVFAKGEYAEAKSGATEENKLKDLYTKEVGGSGIYSQEQWKSLYGGKMPTFEQWKLLRGYSDVLNKQQQVSDSLKYGTGF